MNVPLLSHLSLALLLSFTVAKSGSGQAGCPEALDKVAENTSRIEQAVNYNSFNTWRSFTEYRKMLSDYFMNGLATPVNPGKTIHWVDMGAGLARAQRQVLRHETGIDPSTIRCTAIGVVPPEKDSEKDRRDSYSQDLAYFAEHLPPDRFRYLGGKFFHDIPASEIGEADIITDYMGVITYTADLSL